MIKYICIFYFKDVVMSIKLSETKHSYACKKKVDNAILPGRAYFIVLAVTVILLLSFTVAFFAVFAKTGVASSDSDDNAPISNNSNN